MPNQAKCYGGQIKPSLTYAPIDFLGRKDMCGE